MTTQQIWMRRLEEMWEEFASWQVLDPESRWYGNIPPWKGKDIKHVLSATIPLYTHELSRYHRSPELFERIKLQVGYLLRSQHPSGAVSIVQCNIESPPDTAFHVISIDLCLRLLEQYNYPETEQIQDQMRGFLQRTIPVAVIGGVHTPNHRWVICAALALLKERFGDTDGAMEARVNAYLAEGLDITEYGEWTERSNGIYNTVCGITLFHIWRVFGIQEAWDAMKLNLDMMRYMLHPDHTVATEYSGRQDRGKRYYLNDLYYVLYRVLYTTTGEDIYLSMSEKASIRGGGEDTGRELLYSMVFPSYMDVPVSKEKSGEQLHKLVEEEHYVRLFGEGYVVPVPDRIPYYPYVEKLAPHPHGAAVLRYREGDISVTVMAGEPSFLTFYSGQARIASLRLAMGWFGLTGVQFPTIHQLAADRYHMQVLLEGYYEDALSSSGVDFEPNAHYLSLPNADRNKTHRNTLEIGIEITLLTDGVQLEFEANCDYEVFSQLIFTLDKDIDLEADACQALAEHAIKLCAGEAVLSKGEDRIVIAGGADEHDFVNMTNDVFSQTNRYMTIHWIAPCKNTVTIRSIRGVG